MSEKHQAPGGARILYVLAGLFFLILYLSEKLGGARSEPWWPLAGLSVLCLGLGIFIQLNARVRVQEARNRQARQIEELIGQGSFNGAYYLYLRPFSSTGRVRIANPRKDEIPTPLNLFSLHVPWRLELERVLADALAPQAPLIALGRPGEYFGAGRLPAAEEEWRAVVRRLCNGAAGIFLLPSYRPGILWEIDWLRSSPLLPRCIFIMPPEGRGRACRQEDHWRRTANILRARGVILPVYAPQGGLFSIDSRGRPCIRVELDLTSEGAVRRAVADLLAGKKPRGRQAD